MSQSRFSIVLVGVSALLRRPLVSRLRSAGFTARGSGGFRRWASPSVSAFAAGRVGLRAHGFRFSARTASGLPLGELVFGLTASAFGMHRFGVATRRVGASARRVGSSAFRFGDGRSAGWPSGSRLPLFGTHRFGVALGELVLLPSVSEIAAGRVDASAFHFGVAARRVGLRAHCFRFSACTVSELPLGELVLPLSVSEIPLGGLAFGLIASAFRHAPIRTAAPPKRGPTEHTDTTLVSLQTLIPTC